MKKIRFAVFACAALTLISLPVLSAQEKPSAPPADGAGATDAAFAKALDYFARTQQQDGSWHTKGGRGLMVPGSKRMDHYTAIDTRVGLACMVGLSMIGDGSTPAKGKYAKNLASVLDFTLKGIENADFGKSNHGAFTVPFIVAFLAELLAVPDRLDDAQKAKAKAGLEKAVKAILGGQKMGDEMGACKGCWGYGLDEALGKRKKEPGSCAAVMGLLLARDAGIAVPETSIAQGMTYIKSCAVPNRGDFAYQTSNQAPNNYGGYARTAGACYCLNRTGEAESAVSKAAQTWLEKNHPTKDMQGHEGTFVPWAWFFGALNANQLDAAKRDAYFTARHKDMIAKQQADGTWNIKGTAVPLNMHAAMSTLALAIQKNGIEVFKPKKAADK